MDVVDVVPSKIEPFFCLLVPPPTPSLQTSRLAEYIIHDCARPVVADVKDNLVGLAAKTASTQKTPIPGVKGKSYFRISIPPGRTIITGYFYPRYDIPRKAIPPHIFMGVYQNPRVITPSIFCTG